MEKSNSIAFDIEFKENTNTTPSNIQEKLNKRKEMLENSDEKMNFEN